jgi:PAP2 superfamily
MKRLLIGIVVFAVITAAFRTRVMHAAVPDPITEWSIASQTAVAAAGMAPLRTPITFAILHLAMYDAVNAVVQDREPYAVSPSVHRPASAFAAAVEAGYRVLLMEVPSQKAALDAKYAQLTASIPDSQEKMSGAAVGAAVAQQFQLLRANDGRNLNIPYTPMPGPGMWIPTPPAFLPATTAFLARVTPFTMDTPWQFRPNGPPPLDSRQWARDYNEVKTLGARDSSLRTPEQTATALFWEPLAGTVWPATIRRLAREQGLDLPSSAHFQAAAFAAFADGLIACWDAKFYFTSWRPVTAILQGDTDGNDLTAPDAGWEPLANTPNFPEYPSGHTCATAAVAHTIEDFFAHDVLIPTRNVNTGEERFFRKASQAIDEVIEARMLLGLHFRSGDEDGADIGRKVARQIRSRWFKRAHP